MTPARMMEMAHVLADVTRDYVAKSIGGLTERLAALEQRIATVKDGAPGPAGLPGMAGPPGEPGVGSVGPQGPMGERGEKGERGERGDIGPSGSEGAGGRDGRDGLPGVPGAPGEKGLDGTHGRDGVDGKDGLGVDDIQVEHDGARAFTIKFVQGERVKTIGAFSIPAMLYQGTWQKAQDYVYQDVVSWAGSMWVCTHPTTTAQPGAELVEPKAWELAVRRGAEGKPGTKGDIGLQGARGPQGEPGRGHY